METVEHWWNGLWGTLNRRDIWLRRNPAGPLWEIEARQAGRTALGEFATEEQARTMVAGLTSAGPGVWRRVPLSYAAPALPVGGQPGAGRED